MTRAPDPLAWARDELTRRALDEATLTPSVDDLVTGRDPVRRARHLRRRAAGLSRADARHWLALAATQQRPNNV